MCRRFLRTLGDFGIEQALIEFCDNYLEIDYYEVFEQFPSELSLEDTEDDEEEIENQCESSDEANEF